MAESTTPSKLMGKLDALPKEELIKYVKKQASQMKDLKKKTEDLNTTIKHQKEHMEKLEQEQKAWLSRGVTAEFEKKEELEKKERELKMAAHLGQQMLQENDKLRTRCTELEQENKSMREEINIEIARVDAEKETVDQTLVMVQSEYKLAKTEAQQLKEALELAAADHDKEHERWEDEILKLKETIMELQKESNKTSARMNGGDAETNKTLQAKIDELQEQLDSFSKQGDASEEALAENQELRAKAEANSVELKAQNESLNFLRKKCDELTAKNEELHQYVNMLSTERDESNAYSKQLDEEVRKLKEEKEKMIRSIKNAKSKLEKATTLEEELKTQLNSLASDKSELQLMVKNLQREKKTVMQSNKKLKDKMKISSGRRQSLEEMNGDKTLQMENEELRKELDAFRVKLESEEGHNGSFQSEIKDLKDQKVNMMKELEVVRKQLGDTEKDLIKSELEKEDDKASSIKLQGRVDELLSTLQSLNEEKMHQETEIEELFKTHDLLQVKYDDECRSKMEREQKLKCLEDQLEKQQQSFDALANELSVLKSDSGPKDTQDIAVNTEPESEDIPDGSTLIAEVTESQMISELNVKIRQLEEELEVERQEVKVLQSNFREKVSSVEEFEENEKQIASINEESKKEVELLRTELEDLRHALSEKQGHEEKDADENSMLEEIAKLRCVLDEKEAAFEIVKREKSDVLQELKELQESFEGLSARMKERNEDDDKKEKERKELFDETERLNAFLKEKDATIIKVETELDELKCKETKLNEELARLKELAGKEDQKASSNDLDKYKKGYKKIKEKFNEVGALNEQLKHELQAKNVEVEELKKQVMEQRNPIENVDENNSDPEKTNNENYLEVIAEKELLISQLKEELVVYEQKFSELEAIGKELRQGNEDAEKRLETLRMESSDRVSLLKDFETKNDEQQRKIDELIGFSKQAEELSKLLEDEQIKFSHLQEDRMIMETENKNSTIIINELKEKLGEKDNFIFDLRNQFEMLENSDNERNRNKDVEISELKDELAELSRRLEASMNEAEMQRSDIQEKQRMIMDLQNSLQLSKEHLNSKVEEFDAEKQRLENSVKDSEVISCEKEELSCRFLESIEKISLLEENKVELETMLRDKENEIKQKTEAFQHELKLSKGDSDSLTELKHEIEIIKCASGENERKIQEYELLLQEKDENIAHVTEELARVRTASEEESMASESERNKVGALEKEVAETCREIDSLRTRNKEMTDKVSKFKSVAIKAKKEIDLMKEKTSNEKQQLEETIQALKKDIQSHSDGFEKQNSSLASLRQDYERVKVDLEEMTEKASKEGKRSLENQELRNSLTKELDKLQVSVATLENQKASLEVTLKEKDETATTLASQLSEVIGEKNRLEQRLAQEKVEHEAAKSSLSKALGEFEVAKKDVHQMKMISLEMEDYHRTVESLQAKLSDRENECESAKTQVTELEAQIGELNNQIASLDEVNKNANQEITKLSSQLLQRDEDLSKTLTEKEESERKAEGLTRNLEDISRKCEEKTIQMSELAAEREKALQQLKREKEAHHKDTQAMELKLTRATTDLSLLQEAYENCKKEFESYKIRAQNVLKQQKLKSTDGGEPLSAQEKTRLEDALSQLKERLLEANAKLTSMIAENEELETEQEKLQKDYNKLVEVTKAKELEWRNRFTELQGGLKKQVAEKEETISSLSQENDSLKIKLKSTEEYETMAQDYEKTIKELQDQIRKMQQLVKRRNSGEKKAHASDGDAKEQRGTPEKLKLSFDSQGSHGLVERPGAEGMDSTELEAIDKSSLPATPVSAEAVNILEKILSPTEQNQQLWPMSPTASKEEGLKLRTALTTAEKNVEHLSVLLAETEGSNVRLAEQIKVLKTEIRRMQQNQEREEALSNLEYLKNVIIKFMKCGATERECMVPVLTTMLKLTQEEKQFVTEFAKGESDQGGEDATGWSSYVYRWTSFS